MINGDGVFVSNLRFQCIPGTSRRDDVWKISTTAWAGVIGQIVLDKPLITGNGFIQEVNAL